MKIFSAAQIKDAERLTLEKQEITSSELMERAATLVFNEIHSSLQGSRNSIKIFSGIGNNGGDGLVIARLLLEEGYNVTTYVVNYSDKRSDNFLLNYDKIKNITNDWPILLTSEEDFPEIKSDDLLIDAIFGIGLNRPLLEWTANLIKYINKSGAFVISVDMPSGMFADEPAGDASSIIRANHTYTFQAPKLAFFLPSTGTFTGNLQVLGIGLDPEYLLSTNTLAQLIGKPAARMMYRPRHKFSHKNDFGHSLLVGGSYGKMGSIRLAASACMRSGSGLATAFVPKTGYHILQASVPEVMVLCDTEDKLISEIEYDFEPAVVCFGIGAGQEEKTLSAFEKLLEKVEKPMLIDADGINLLAKKKGLLLKLPQNSILTPHLGELKRLLGSWNSDFDMLERARQFVKKYGVILIIKGAHSITVTNEEIFINNSGNPGMATAGSGDVLAGIITGLLSQNYAPVNAAVLGVFLHGRAGDLAAREKGHESLLASDIVSSLGRAFLDLFKSKTPKKK